MQGHGSGCPRSVCLRVSSLSLSGLGKQRLSGTRNKYRQVLGELLVHFLCTTEMPMSKHQDLSILGSLSTYQPTLSVFFPLVGEKLNCCHVFLVCSNMSMFAFQRFPADLKLKCPHPSTSSHHIYLKLTDTRDQACIILNINIHLAIIYRSQRLNLQEACFVVMQVLQGKAH